MFYYIINLLTKKNIQFLIKYYKFKNFSKKIIDKIKIKK